MSTATSKSSGSGSDLHKIKKLQDLDKWRAEQTEEIPIDITELRLVEIHAHELTLKVRTSSGSEWQRYTGVRNLKDFTKDLDLAFPIEAGHIGKHSRIIPYLSSSRRLFGGKYYSQENIQEYFDRLLKLPRYMLKSRVFVNNFLRQTENEHYQAKSEHASESSSLLSTPIEDCKATKMKVKVKVGSEMSMIFLEANHININDFMTQVRAKLTTNISNDLNFSYIDQEGDRINVIDDEDLKIALKFGSNGLRFESIN